MKGEKILIGFFILTIHLSPFSNIFAEKCLKAEDDPYKDGLNHQLIREIRENNISGLQNAIQEGLDVNKAICACGDDETRRYYFLITTAAEIGNLKIVKLLVEAGADVGKKSIPLESNCGHYNGPSYNALYHASQYPEIVSYLKSLGIKDEVEENKKKVRDLQEKIKSLEPDKESLKLLLGEWKKTKTCENQKCANSMSQPVLSFQENRKGHYSWSFDDGGEDYDFDFNLKGKEILARLSHGDTTLNLIVSKILKLNKKTLILQDENSKYQSVYKRVKK